jgi:hypothetical protein
VLKKKLLPSPQDFGTDPPLFARGWKGTQEVVNADLIDSGTFLRFCLFFQMFFYLRKPFALVYSLSYKEIIYNLPALRCCFGSFAKIYLKQNNHYLQWDLFYDFQVNLKTRKHLILTLNLAKIGTSLLMAQNLCYRHLYRRLFLMN